MQLDLVDEILLLSHGSIRSLDCIIALELSKVPELKDLEEGAKKAQTLFNKTSFHPVKIGTHANLDSFINSPLENVWHLEIGIIQNLLALKMSHVLGDAVSMILWLKALLGEEVVVSPIKLQTFPPKKDSPYRYIRNSEVWPKEKSVTRERKIDQLILHHKDKYDTFTINDLLSLAVLMSIPRKRKSLWVPVNIRQQSWVGFGNGLSRMRLYPPKENLSVQDGLAFLKKQKKEARTNGEIFMSTTEKKLNNFQKNLVKLWINRPWADWASISFSHLHDRENTLPFSNGLIGVTNLIEKQQAGVFAFTKGQKTWITLTMDKSAHSKETSNKFLDDISKNFENIKGSFDV
jgi:hypothetical protein